MRCIDCKFIIKHLDCWTRMISPSYGDNCPGVAEKRYTPIFWCGHSKIDRYLAMREVENEAPCDCPESRPVEY